MAVVPACRLEGDVGASWSVTQPIWQSLIVLEIDYDVDVAIADELGEERFSRDVLT